MAVECRKEEDTDKVEEGDRLMGDTFEKGREEGDTGKVMHQAAALELYPVGRSDKGA